MTAADTLILVLAAHQLFPTGRVIRENDAVRIAIEAADLAQQHLRLDEADIPILQIAREMALTGRPKVLSAPGKLAIGSSDKTGVWLGAKVDSVQHSSARKPCQSIYTEATGANLIAR